MTKSIKMILLPLIIIWLIIVVTGYYWGHQYVLIPPVVGIIRSLVLIVIGLLFFSTALGLGWLALKPFGIPFDSRINASIYSIGLGMCLMSLIVLVLGFFGFLNQAVFWSMSIVGTVTAIILLARENRRAPFTMKVVSSGLERIDYFLLAFTGITIFLGLQLTLAPPIGWDGLTTHLVFVREILDAGKLEPVPVTPGRFAGHLLFAWGMALGGDVIPQLISYGMGLLLVASVFIFTHRNFGLRIAVLAAAVFVSVEIFILNAGWPYLDVPVAFFSWMAVSSLFNWQQNRTYTRHWLILSAIFAVFASHVKLNGLFLFPVMFVGYLLGLYWNRNNLRRRLIDGIAALAFALILIFIWSAAEAGLDPGETFVSVLPPQAESVANRLPTIDNLTTKLVDYVKVLWEMTIIGQQGAVIYDGTISPLFLLLFPVLILLRNKPRAVISLIAAVLVELAAWLVFPREYYQNRHLIIAYPIFAVLTAYVIYRLDEFDFEWFSLSGFFRLLLVLIFSLQLLSTLVWWQSVNPMSYLLGMQSRDGFLAANLNSGSSPGYYDMMKVIKDKVPEESVVGMLWPEPRLYYCPGTCVRFPFAGARTVEEMLSKTADKSLTHVLVSQGGLEFYLDFYGEDEPRKKDREQFQRELSLFTNRYGQLVHNQDDSFYLFRIGLDGVGE